MLKKLLNRFPQKKNIIIVSGLPRSGTSMMMRMLEEGGVSPLTDQLRAADSDNPKGYYEFERVKKLDKGDTAWVEDAVGKAVKVIAALLKYLPSEYTYKVIFMRRKIEEVLASQKQMLINRGEPTDLVSDEELRRLFEKHLQHIDAWAHRQNNVNFLYVSYNDLLVNPRPHLERVNQFLGDKLNLEKMIKVVDPNLYRQRRE